MFVSIGKAAKMLDLSVSTLRRWETECDFQPAFRTKGGHRRYSLSQLLEFSKQLVNPGSKFELSATVPKNVVVYGRVSSSRQKQDLVRQVEHLQSYARQKQWTVVATYTDVGSGLNDKRKGLLRLIRELPIWQPYKIVCSYPDRLARFGTNVIQTFCELFSTTIEITHPPQSTMPVQEQLTQDFIALIMSFAGKAYRLRRGQQKTMNL